MDAPPVRGRATAAAVAAAGLTALAVAMGVGRFAFTPILPLMQQERGLSVGDGAWLASANYLGYLLGAVAVSAVATRVRPATGIRGGLLVIAIATLGMGVAGRFGAWVALRALAGAASASVLVFASAWCLERLATAGRPRLSGMVFAGVGVGIAVAGAYCLVLMRAGAGSTQAWRGLGVASLLATAATWRVFAAGDTARPNDARRFPPPPRRFDAETARLVACYGAFGFGYAQDRIGKVVALRVTIVGWIAMVVVAFFS